MKKIDLDKDPTFAEIQLVKLVQGHKNSKYSSLTHENIGSYFTLSNHVCIEVWKDFFSTQLQEIFHVHDLEIIRSKIPLYYLREGKGAIKVSSLLVHTQALPVNSDIGYTLGIAHEIGHHIIHILKPDSDLNGKREAEEFSDIVAGFTLKKLEERGYIGVNDSELASQDFFNLGGGKVHGTGRERVSSLLLGYNSSDDKMKERILDIK